MKCFGIRKVFAVEYEMIDAISGYFEMWVDNKAVCQYEKNSTEWKYEWNLLYIVEWLSKNLTSILCEVEFPLPVSANSSIDFLNKSNEFDSDDIDEFERWFEKDKIGILDIRGIPAVEAHTWQTLFLGELPIQLRLNGIT